ncbi:MAG: hypothetical protein GF308_19000 [Candidatus Heimdallarchaeota archaeon]|nr:hypothetical protein [Candidatus Heimdallarchaeota archaeon]
MTCQKKGSSIRKVLFPTSFLNEIRDRYLERTWINEVSGLMVGYQEQEQAIVTALFFPYQQISTGVNTAFGPKAIVKCRNALNKAGSPGKKGQNIIGWIHTHPGLRVFMSSTDRKTFSNWPWKENHIAIVVDPYEITEDYLESKEFEKGKGKSYIKAYDTNIEELGLKLVENPNFLEKQELAFLQNWLDELNNDYPFSKNRQILATIIQEEPLPITPAISRREGGVLFPMNVEKTDKLLESFKETNHAFLNNVHNILDLVIKNQIAIYYENSAMKSNLKTLSESQKTELRKTKNNLMEEFSKIAAESKGLSDLMNDKFLELSEVVNQLFDKVNYSVNNNFEKMLDKLEELEDVYKATFDEDRIQKLVEQLQVTEEIIEKSKAIEEKTTFLSEEAQKIEEKLNSFQREIESYWKNHSQKELYFSKEVGEEDLEEIIQANDLNKRKIRIPYSYFIYSNGLVTKIKREDDTIKTKKYNWNKQLKKVSITEMQSGLLLRISRRTKVFLFCKDFITLQNLFARFSKEVTYIPLKKNNENNQPLEENQNED